MAQLLEHEVQRAPAPAPPKRRPPVVALSALAGLLAAVLAVFTVHLGPPWVAPRHLSIAAAETRLMVDAPRSLAIDPHVRSADFQSLTYRADWLAALLVTRPVAERIAQRAAIPVDGLSTVFRARKDVPLALIEPGSEARAYQILRSSTPYRLEVQARGTDPVVDVYAQAPTPEAARRLADVAVQGLRDYLRRLALAQGLPAGGVPVVYQLGRARGGVINRPIVPETAALAFLVVFGITCTVLLIAVRARRPRLALPALESAVDESESPGDEEELRRDDWPHTTRLLRGWSPRCSSSSGSSRSTRSSSTSRSPST